MLRLCCTAIAVVLLAGCSDGEAILVPPPGLDRPPGAQPFEPPPVYAERYRAMERCASLKGDFARVRWFVVPGRSWINTAAPGGQRIAGQWWPPHDIYLAESVVDYTVAVDHEILHDLVREAGHPAPPFGGNCAPTTIPMR